MSYVFIRILLQAPELLTPEPKLEVVLKAVIIELGAIRLKTFLPPTFSADDFDDEYLIPYRVILKGLGSKVQKAAYSHPEGVITRMTVYVASARERAAAAQKAEEVRAEEAERVLLAAERLAAEAEAARLAAEAAQATQRLAEAAEKAVREAAASQRAAGTAAAAGSHLPPLSCTRPASFCCGY